MHDVLPVKRYTNKKREHTRLDLNYHLRLSEPVSASNLHSETTWRKPRIGSFFTSEKSTIFLSSTSV